MNVFHDRLFDKWLVIGLATGPVYFDSAEEAYKVSDKTDFVEAVMRVMDKLGDAMREAPDLWQQYFDCGYNDGGSDPITSEEIASTGKKKEQVASMITVLENFNKFCNGGNPVNDTYRIHINKSRRTK